MGEAFLGNVLWLLPLLLWEELAHGAKGIRLMGQRHRGLGEILESLEWQPQKGLEVALSPKKLERRLRRGPVRRGVGSGSFIIQTMRIGCCLKR